jgi:hypothetical protein
VSQSTPCYLGYYTGSLPGDTYSVYDNRWTANEIIRLLLLDPDGDHDLMGSVEEHRKHDNWEKAKESCWQQYIQASDEFSPKAGYWKGVYCMYQGVYWYTQDQLVQARACFICGSRAFGLEDHWYGLGIALIGQGQACETLGRKEEALSLYATSYRIIKELQERCELWRHPPTDCHYQALCDKLQSMMDKVKEPTQLHLLPVLGEVRAGLPLYMPGEDSQDSFEEIVLDGTKYELLTLGGEKIKKNLPSDAKSDRYYVVTARGDSMVGSGIRDRDRLLVRQQNTDLNQRDIVVFEEEDSGPMVKRYYHTANRIYLESANPNYKTRVYAGNELRIYGLVVGKLEKSQTGS